MKRHCIVALIVCLLMSCAEEKPKVLEGMVYGSTFQIQYFGEKDFSKEVESIFKEIDNSLSTYRSDSEISKWNAGNDSLKLSVYFIEIAELSKNIFERTNGYFDPTVKTLVEGWGFGNGIPKNILNQKEVDSLLKNVGFNKLSIHSKERTISKPSPYVELDFNSITPGYTADKVAEMFDKNNIENYLIDIGGEIKAKGTNIAKNKAWVVGIEDPTKPITQRKVLTTVELQDKSLATSGNYRKIKEDSLGRTIVHTINPKTGYPVTSHLLSATIVTKECSEADAYATAIMAMDEVQRDSIISSLQLSSYLVYDKNGMLELKNFNN